MNLSCYKTLCVSVCLSSPQPVFLLFPLHTLLSYELLPPPFPPTFPLSLLPSFSPCLPWSLLPTPLPQPFPFGALLPAALPVTAVWVPPPFSSQTHFQDSFKQRPLANSAGVPAWCDAAMPGNSPMLSPGRTSAPPSAEAGWRGDLPKHYLELKECGHGGVAA